MAKLLTGQFNSKKQVTFFVYIYDEDLGMDSTDEMQITSRPVWNWDGSDKDLYQTIKAGNYTVGINVPGSGAVKTFVDALIAETDEHRYWMQIVRNGVEKFRGWLQIDQSTIPIRSRTDFPFTLRATDSLGLLGNYDYIDPATPEDPYRGAISVKDHLRLILLSADISELYGASDPFLSVSTVYHNSLMPNTTDDFSDRIYIDHRKFAAKVEEQFSDIVFLVETSIGSQPVEAGNARETLEQLCFQFNAVFFHSNGHYYFISRERLLSGPSIPLWTYATDGSLLNTTAESRAVTIGSQTVNNTGYFMYNEGGTYTYLTPIKELIIDHQRGGGNNKIVGQEWIIENHPEVCFDEINNAGNAYIVGRFVVKYSVKYIVGTDTGFFRIRLGLIIKVGTKYLHRNVESGFDVWSNGPGNYPTSQIPYQDAAWSDVVGYWNIILDTPAGLSFGFGDNYTTIIDIESPAIPASGQLCVDVVFLELRKFDSFTILGDDQWDTVTFSDEDTFSRDGKTWDLYWEFKDNYLNIQSDDSEVNEDTLAYTRYRATVNPRNSERLEYSTGIGDDKGSNTHGRIQIDKSAGLDGSDLEDADGGWTINGAGTVWDHFVKLLAWDMARLRVGIVRIMNCVLNTTVDTFEPHTLTTFDGKVSIMGNVQCDAISEDCGGNWYSIEDVDNTKVTVTDKAYSISKGKSPNETITDPISDDVSYIHEVTGITTLRIAVPAASPLPDPDVYSYAQINAMFRKAIRGTANLKFKDTLSLPTDIGIDNATNEIILQRIPSTTDEFFFHWKF